MTLDIEQNRWRTILQQQGRANAQRWLTTIEADPNDILINYDNLLHALESTLRTASTFDLAYRLIKALHTTVTNLGDWERWLVYLRSALALASEAKLAHKQAQILEYIGRTLRYLGHLEASIDNYQQSSNIHRQLNDQLNYGRVRILVADIYTTQGQLEEARILCQASLTLANILQDAELIARSNFQLSHIYYQLQEWEQALTFIHSAYQYFQKAGLDSGLDQTLISLVAYYPKLDQWGEANHYAEILRLRLEQAGNDFGLLRLKINLGIIAYDRADYQNAERLWQEALKLQSQIGELTTKAMLTNNLGKAYTQLGEWKAAEVMLIDAIHLYKNFGQIQRWANSLDNLADLYEAQGNIPQCCKALQQAIVGLQTIQTDFSNDLLLQQLLDRYNQLCSPS